MRVWQLTHDAFFFSLKQKIMWEISAQIFCLFGICMPYNYVYINGAPPYYKFKTYAVLTVLTLFFDFLPSLQNRYQAFVFDLVESRKFEMFIILVITINMIVMMVQHYDQPEEVTFVLDIL